MQPVVYVIEQGGGPLDGHSLGLVSTIVVAIIGAILNEKYKRHRDATATAAALAGELASYKGALDSLDLSLPVLIDRAASGQPLNIPEQEHPRDVAFEAYVDKIGLLGSKLAEEVTFVYGQIRGFRSAFFMLSKNNGKLDPTYVASTIRTSHTFAMTAKRHADPLVEDLRKVAARSFWRNLF